MRRESGRIASRPLDAGCRENPAYYHARGEALEMAEQGHLEGARQIGLPLGVKRGLTSLE